MINAHNSSNRCNTLWKWNPTVQSIDAMIHKFIMQFIGRILQQFIRALWNHLSSMVKSNSAKSPSATSASTDLSGSLSPWGRTNPSAAIEHQQDRGSAYKKMAVERQIRRICNFLKELQDVLHSNFYIRFIHVHYLEEVSSIFGWTFLISKCLLDSTHTQQHCKLGKKSKTTSTISVPPPIFPKLTEQSQSFW